MKILLLAAGKGSRIFKKIKKNKCLINVFKKTLIEHIIDNSKNSAKEIYCVVGFKQNKIKHYLRKYNLKYVYNKKYSSTDMLYSTYLGLKKIKSDNVLIIYTDTYYEKSFIKKICKIESNNIVVPISLIWKKMWEIRKKKIKSDAEDIKIGHKNYIINIGKKITNKLPKYQYMGVIYIPYGMLDKIKSHMKFCIKRQKKMHLTNFLDFIIKKKEKVKSLKNSKNWYEFDDYRDLINFNNYYEKFNNFNH